MSMNCIDFDRKFQEYVSEWMRANTGKYRNVDEMEIAIPDVYLQWLNRTCDWLSGRSPGDYFYQFDDARHLCNWMYEYNKSNISIPDQLMERLTALGDEAQTVLCEMADNGDTNADMRMIAIGLLREMESTQPMQMYTRWVTDGRDMDEIADNATESLKNMDNVDIQVLILGYENASLSQRAAIADILSHKSTDARVLPLLLRLLGECESKALAASYIGRFGDPAALPALKKMAENIAINYLDYIEILNAIRQLGDECESHREFAGDPYFESMKLMGDA